MVWGGLEGGVDGEALGKAVIASICLTGREAPTRGVTGRLSARASWSACTRTASPLESVKVKPKRRG